MIGLSLALLIVEPISALMIMALVLRHKVALGIHPILRLWLVVLVSGLVIHAAGQVELLADYRPPRTLAWLPMVAAINGTIWTAYFTDLVRRRSEGKRSRFDDTFGY